MHPTLVTVGVGLALLASASAGMAQDRASDEPTLRVLIVNEAHVPRDVLASAEQDAAAIFEAAGVRIVWVPGDPEHAGDDPDFDVAVTFSASAVPSAIARTVPNNTLGFTVIDRTHAGLLAQFVWVRYDQVDRYALQRQVQISRLCGLVMAHEIGHTLLTAGHSDRGLMRRTWELGVSAPLEHFTDAQADAMRVRLESVRKQRP
jgi:hypothetical protein